MTTRPADSAAPERTRLGVAQRALAGLMAAAGFAVPSKNRDEQWDAPIDEAASILGTMLALDLVVLPTAESRADPDPTGQNSPGESFPGAFVCAACEAGRHRECGTFDCHCGYRGNDLECAEELMGRARCSAGEPR